MNDFPSALENLLEDERFRRPDGNDDVTKFSKILGITPSKSFCDFYSQFQGPIDSDFVGYLLLDILEDNPTALELTQYVREEFEIPNHFVVISDVSARSVLVLNTKNDQVVEMDFDGGVELLLEESLEPRWNSFKEFLNEFFDGCE